MVDWAISIISLWPEIGSEIISIFLNWCVRKEEAEETINCVPPTFINLVCCVSISKVGKNHALIESFTCKHLIDYHNPHVNHLKSPHLVIMTNLRLSHCIIYSYTDTYLIFYIFSSDSDRGRRKKQTFNWQVGIIKLISMFLLLFRCTCSDLNCLFMMLLINLSSTRYSIMIICNFS